MRTTVSLATTKTNAFMHRLGSSGPRLVLLLVVVLLLPSSSSSPSSSVAGVGVLLLRGCPDGGLD